MAAFEAYFDESERPGGTFCVAGYAFLPRQARRFIAEWNTLFRPFDGFHMKHFAHRRGRFSGVSDQQHNQLIRDAVRIVNQRMQFGVAVSCQMEEVMLHGQGVDAFKHAFGMCCYLAMVQLAALMLDSGDDRDIFYTFEAGHPHEGAARDFIRAAVAVPAVKRDLRHAGDAFIPKKDAVPLQAADLLAWEWAKFRDETLDADIRPIRESLRTLFMRDTKRYRCAHVTGERLIHYLKVMPELLRQEGIIDASGRTKVIH